MHRITGKSGLVEKFAGVICTNISDVSRQDISQHCLSPLVSSEDPDTKGSSFFKLLHLEMGV